MRCDGILQALDTHFGRCGLKPGSVCKLTTPQLACGPLQTDIQTKLPNAVDPAPQRRYPHRPRGEGRSLAAQLPKAMRCLALS
jgi:hypothetical protein